MALVIIESPSLTAQQKANLGRVISDALKEEGIAHAVVTFQPERGDIYVDGVLVQDKEEDEVITLNVPKRAKVTIMDTTTPAKKTRRSRAELESLKKRLFNLLQEKKSVSSLEAVTALNIRDCPWAPATLRRLFGELEEAKLVNVTGQKRGTRYSLVESLVETSV
jgi:hypothetical protein